MQENHNDQPIELTYPIEIQFTDPNETNDSNQPMEQDSDRKQTAEPTIRRENITFTLVEQHSSSDKENDGRLIKTEEDIGNSNSESQTFPTSVTPPEEANGRTHPSANDGSVGKAAAQDNGLSERRILTGLLLLKSSRS